MREFDKVSTNKVSDDKVSANKIRFTFSEAALTALNLGPCPSWVLALDLK